MSMVFPSATMDTGPKATHRPESSMSNTAEADKTLHVDTSASTVSTGTMSSSPYHYTVGPGTGSQRPTLQRSRSIKSEEGLDLQGPLEIAGSIKSGGSIKFDGDFAVKDKIDAYGAININGSLNSDGRIKAYGNIDVNGRLVARDKIKGYGKLRVVGSLEGTELEIYGNLSINGHLRCRRLVVYGSLTLIGAESSYQVDESEEVAGAKLRRDQEADWDW